MFRWFEWDRMALGVFVSGWDLMDCISKLVIRQLVQILVNSLYRGTRPIPISRVRDLQIDIE